MRAFRSVSCGLAVAVFLLDVAPRSTRTVGAAEQTDKDVSVSFRTVDEDGDGAISETELARQTGRPPAEVKRDFKLFDRDGDGRLDEAEFATLPSLFSRDRRGRLPDPFLRLVDRYVVLVDSHWDEWDADESGELTPDEFDQGLAEALELPARPAGPGGQFVQGGPGVNLRPPQAHQRIASDFNHDGVVTHDEARASLELLLGVRLPDGQSLRSGGGSVLNLSHFRAIDRNRNNTLDRVEFQNLGVPGIDPAELFARADVDHDGQVSLEEWWWQIPFGGMDPINEFRGLDADLDGLVDSDELRKVPAYKLRVAEHTLPGFDLDGDGKLSLAEYRFSPLANPLVDWYREIADDDGRLTFEQFASLAGEFALLGWRYFERFDVNADGVLDRGEFYFRVRTPEALYALNADGTGWTRLFQMAGYPVIGSPTVSPDGKTIAFDGWQVHANPNGPNDVIGMPAVFAVDIDGANPREICQGQMPSWSANGKLFACSRREGGYGSAIMTLDGQERQRIGNGGWSAQWSPDGKQIAYYEGNKLLVYDVQTRQSRDVLGAAHAYQQIFWNMCWSPDSKQICFKGISMQGREELVLVDAAGAERGIRVRYSAGPFSSKCAWHPKESRIVFARPDPERRVMQLFQLDPQTNDPPAWVTGQDPATHNEDPCWTPDGKRLIVVNGIY
ncbi:MAG TPA: EF-hand domain-containing protein [Pirellulales bacterium]|nr:EF-hand domain-containing protein [Pirellulales bacterium]